MTPGNPTPNEIHTQIQYRLIEKLEASERRYRLMVENLQEIVFNINQQGELTFLNSAWQKTLGYSLEESLHVPLSRFVNLEQSEENKQLLTTILDRQNKARTELSFKHQNGQIIWLELSANPNPAGGISGTLTDITERKQAIAKLEYAAFHDNLTGLYNRVGLMRYLKQEIAYTQQNEQNVFALLFLDLDGFKLVNDSLGHLMGDLLLIEVAKRLQQCLKKTDILARFGGDEFIILLSNIVEVNNAIAVSRQIQQVLKPGFNLNEQEAFIGTSIGIVLSNQEEKEAETFLRDGDIALYKAKSNGKGTYAIFDNRMLAQTRERMQIETYLRQDIKTNNFEVYYQPIIATNSMKILGFEALLRWNQRNLGSVSPSKFIPIAEETGLIIELGKQILSQACQQVSNWQKTFLKNDSFFISINLSIKQFSQINLITEIQKILIETNLSPQNLKLEITESIMMSNMKVNVAKMQVLKKLGIQICIDDFGTGYSSLSYLHRFPIDVLKIDRSFVNCLKEKKENQEIIEAIIILAHKLGMEVVAEGVETKAQLNQLKLLGCEQIQGYLFSPALSPKSMEKLLTKIFVGESLAHDLPSI